jgi:hypothetical protein
MKHIISFSGGLGSFWTAHRVIERHGKADVTLLFADTCMEDEDLYRFNRDASSLLGVPITRITDGRTPWEVFRDVRFLGNSRVDPCSKILKRELLDRWHRENCYEMATIVYVGVDWTETHRLDRLRARKPEWRIEAPMTEAPLWDKNRMICESDRIGLTPPRLYKMGFPHNNCGGFCVKAGQGHFAHLLKTMPERYAYHEQQEQDLRVALGRDDIGILKDKNGPFTLRELRQRIEGGKAFDPLEWGGCGCAIDAEAEAKK